MSLQLHIVDELVNNEYYKDIMLNIGKTLIYLDVYKVMRMNLTSKEMLVVTMLEDNLTTNLLDLGPIVYGFGSDVENIYHLARELYINE
jgi:hypothetical protein